MAQRQYIPPLMIDSISHTHDTDNQLTAIDGHTDDGTHYNRAYSYDAFSAPVSCIMNPASCILPAAFSSKEHDTQSGLSYYGFRYYDPASVRWMNKEPVKTVSDPAFYKFSANNPMQHVDHYGLVAMSLLSWRESCKCVPESERVLTEQSAKMHYQQVRRNISSLKTLDETRRQKLIICTLSALVTTRVNCLNSDALWRCTYAARRQAFIVNLNLTDYDARKGGMCILHEIAHYCLGKVFYPLGPALEPPQEKQDVKEAWRAYPGGLSGSEDDPYTIDRDIRLFHGM